MLQLWVLMMIAICVDVLNVLNEILKRMAVAIRKSQVATNTLVQLIWNFVNDG
jgi:hypothetical protein